MSTKYDRFACGITPTIPDEVGHCAGCGAMMYDYEALKCPMCDRTVHQGCLMECDACREKCCKHDLKERDGYFVCEVCDDPQILAALRAAATGNYKDLQKYLKLRRTA